jgi:glycosyltransferase involved in cell wall biosynthesis
MISVCIATYNAKKYIHTQISSILNQLGSADEIIISDDFSDDDTLEIVTKINDSRIKIIRGQSRLGVIKNFERSLYAASGDIIFLADQDDVWLPNKVVKCKQILANHMLVVTDCKVVDSELNPISESFFALKSSGKGIVKNIFKNSYIGCCIAFRRELLDVALPFPDQVPMHDVWIGLLAEIIGKVTFMPEPLVLYRRHGANASFLESRNSVFKKIKFRFLLVINLVFRLVSVTFKKIRA